LVVAYGTNGASFLQEGPMIATRLTTEATPPPVPHIPGEHFTSLFGPGKDVVRGGIQGQRAPAVADASTLLEGTKGCSRDDCP